MFMELYEQVAEWPKRPWNINIANIFQNMHPRVLGTEQFTYHYKFYA